MPERSADVQGPISDAGNGVGGGSSADLAGTGTIAGGVDLGRGGGSMSCVDGGGCMTANPGACASGHLVCSGPAATCVPDVTTQRCYSGPAATVGVGVCKAGAQTCVGTLGSCAGEVKPAAIENCFNDLDDDCDGKVNNGCPDHLVTGTPVKLPAQGNTSGGNPFSLRCPANSYVTKVVVYGDNGDRFIGGIDISCATPTLVRGASTYSVTPTPVTANPSSVHANHITTSASSPFDCGTTAFHPGYYVPGDAYGSGVDGLGMACGIGTLSLSASNQLTIAFSKDLDNGFYGYDNTTQFEDDCGAGTVLVGFDGRDGDWFDDIQPVCAPLQVVYK
jgi:hypothetical protein